MSMSRLARPLVAAASLLAAGHASALTIEFDYGYDDGAVRLSDGQKAILASVADEFGARLTDTLDAATYRSIAFYDPGVAPTSAGSIVNQSNFTVAADTIHIFVAAAELDALGSATLGSGGPGGGSGNDRGELDVGATDFAPWGGQISFDIRSDWYLDDDPRTLETFSGFDFYSVAVHELAHVLGFGISNSWSTQVNATGFAGEASVAAYGGTVPLTGDDAHWANGTASFVNGVLQPAALTASIAGGSRKYMTELDWAALSDIGWQVAAAVPEPENWAMMLAGLGLVGLGLHRRQSRCTPV